MKKEIPTNFFLQIGAKFMNGLHLKESHQKVSQDLGSGDKFKTKRTALLLPKEGAHQANQPFSVPSGKAKCQPFMKITKTWMTSKKKLATSASATCQHKISISISNQLRTIRLLVLILNAQNKQIL